MLVDHAAVYQVVGVLEYKTRRRLKPPVPMDSSENACPALKYQERPRRQRRTEQEPATICARWQDCDTKEPKGYDFSGETAASVARVKIRALPDSGKFVLEDRRASECDACIGRHSDASPTCSRALRLPTIAAQDPSRPLIDMVTRLPVDGWFLHGSVDVATSSAELNFRPP